MHYDNAIFNWFSNKITKNKEEYLFLEGKKIEDLRYGENPHQVASIFSFNNKKDRFFKQFIPIFIF